MLLTDGAGPFLHRRLLLLRAHALHIRIGAFQMGAFMIASTKFWPCETRTSTCRSFATISSGLYRFLARAVLLDVKDIPQVGAAFLHQAADADATPRFDVFFDDVSRRIEEDDGLPERAEHQRHREREHGERGTNQGEALLLAGHSAAARLLAFKTNSSEEVVAVTQLDRISGQRPPITCVLTLSIMRKSIQVRMRRIMLAMSQEKLGAALGLTFQQVQKYEKGTNRIGASRLQQISHILQVPVAFFFEGLPNELAPSALSVAQIDDFISDSDGLRLIGAFMRIDNAALRRRIVMLVQEIAGDDD